MATDLAEFLGAALGFHLLFGIGALPGRGADRRPAFVILGLQRFGFRPLEAVIAVFVGVIGACYLAELFYAHPPLGTVAMHAVTPDVRRQRVGAARGRHSRRDGDAARDLPALGADAEPDRPRERRGGEAAVCATRGSTS